MRKIALCTFLFSAALCAQTAETAYFRAVLSSANEIPANNTNASGVADIVAHVVRDSSGLITSGSVQFLVRINIPAADDKTSYNAIGLHIHNGGPTISGPVVIGTALSAANPQVVKAGGDVVNLPVQIAAEGNALTHLRRLFSDPSEYYVNIHTTEFGGGIARGQMQRAIGTVLMGVMSSENEVPPQAVEASGFATVVAIATLNPNGSLASGETYLQATYSIPDGGTFSGFHIHPGLAGALGPASLQATLPTGAAAIPVAASGVMGPYYTELNLGNATQVDTFTRLFTNPSATYINLHTAPLHGGGVIRAQLRNTDNMTFPVLMDWTNEVAQTINLKSQAPALISVRTLRNEDGSIAAGSVFFDVNYRFPSPTTITGLHIHDGPAGVNAPVSIPIIPSVDTAFPTPTGFGNYYNWTPGVLNLAILEDISKNPENHYVNIHTAADPGGSARAQLAAPVTSAGQVAAIIAANLDRTATTVAPGGLLSIFGVRLVKVATDLSGWAGRTLPVSLNGTKVTIGGKDAPLLYVSPNQINAQVPVDLAPGPHPVVVHNGVGPSAAFTLTVAAVAPAVFTNPANVQEAAVLKNSNFSVVSASNPAAVGDVILVYATGLGQTTPAITTGGIVPATTIANTSTVTATIGGQPANVIYSIASPGYAGMYQVAITVPAGVSGSVPVVLTQNGVRSAAPNLQVR